MNENDKILINAYLDGETSEDESKYIESLFKSSNEANEFANNIKRANTEINSYFNSSELKDLEIDMDAFIADIKSHNQESTFFNSLKNFFTPQSFAGYALTASFVYFVMLPVNEDIIQQSFFAEDFLSFGNETNNYYYEKYRGAEDLGDISKDYIIQTINKMIESKTINSVMNYGDDSYFIKVEDLSIDKESIYCLEGYILNTGIKTNFLYCKSDQDETITYLN
ncbi:hypothetical protein OAV70_01800 [Gammaproteobacteria bacterium]|nr:hypothetical protein [Gammaproteobacteria bacterium]